MDVFVTGVVDDWAQEIENSIESTYSLKNTHYVWNVEFLKLLLTNLDTNLDILSIMFHHVTNALDNPVAFQISYKVSQPLLVHLSSIDNDPLDIFNVGVILQCSLE